MIKILDQSGSTVDRQLPEICELESENCQTFKFHAVEAMGKFLKCCSDGKKAGVLQSRN